MESLNLSPNENKSSQTGPDYETIAQAKGGASWFYWIAGLSLVNSLVFFFGGNLSFFAGLGITQIIDAIVEQVSPGEGFSFLKAVTLLMDIFIAGIFFICGVLANKFQTWAFIVGMILYLLDGLLLLLIGAYLPAGFHAFALFMIFRGLMAAREVNAAES